MFRSHRKQSLKATVQTISSAVPLPCYCMEYGYTSTMLPHGCKKLKWEKKNLYDAWIIQRRKNPLNLLCRCVSFRVTGILKKRVRHLQIITLAETVNGITSGFGVSRFLFDENHKRHDQTKKKIPTNDQNWMREKVRHIDHATRNLRTEARKIN